MIYEDLENPDGDRMDQECIPICDALNGLPGVKTISSCCGHGHSRFRIYFTVQQLSNLYPVLYFIDESEAWSVRISMASGDRVIYFILEGLMGEMAYLKANLLADALTERSKPCPHCAEDGVIYSSNAN